MDLEKSINSPLTQPQEEIFQALLKLVVDVSQEVIAAFGNAFEAAPEAFLAEHIGDLRQTLADTDGRTMLFLEKMTQAILLHLNSLETVPDFFQVLELLTDDGGIAKALIRSKALPHVHTLIEGCDRIRPSIIDDVIYGKN